jgi:hypothetical protein
MQMSYRGRLNKSVSCQDKHLKFDLHALLELNRRQIGFANDSTSFLKGTI